MPVEHVPHKGHLNQSPNKQDTSRNPAKQAKKRSSYSTALHVSLPIPEGRDANIFIKNTQNVSIEFTEQMYWWEKWSLTSVAFHKNVSRE